ncbi:MAG: Fe-S-containing protein [Candidatus Acidiferrales bacterium]
MLSALVIALREGVEAALVIGIILIYLDRTGRAHLSRHVWTGVAAAVAASFAGAVALQRWQVNQEGFEGVLMLIAAFFVVTMVWWMSRVSRTLKRQIEQRVEGYAQQATMVAKLGLAAFAFLLVLREGVELVLINRAVELSSDGLNIWIGTALGLAIAIAVGVFFFKGTLRIPLPRFFAATSAILAVIAIQLVITGVHELSEALWIPSSKTEMAIIGPIVRNDIYFFVIVLGVAAVVILREWMALRRPAALAAEASGAERRRWQWEQRKQQRWMVAAVFTCAAVVMGLAADFLYARAQAAPPEAKTVAATNGQIRLPLAGLADSNLHIFQVDDGAVAMRFLVIRKPGGEYGTALDACQICGPAGYRQEGLDVICRNCDAAIYIPSIGDSGGCNPIGVASRTEGGELVLEVTALSEAAKRIHH